MTTSAPTAPALAHPMYRKAITMDRPTREYAATLDGEIVGFFATYHAAEVALDNIVYQQLAHAPRQQQAEQQHQQHDDSAPAAPIVADPLLAEADAVLEEAAEVAYLYGEHLAEQARAASPFTVGELVTFTPASVWTRTYPDGGEITNLPLTFDSISPDYYRVLCDTPTGDYDIVWAKADEMQGKAAQHPPATDPLRVALQTIIHLAETRQTGPSENYTHIIEVARAAIGDPVVLAL